MSLWTDVNNRPSRRPPPPGPTPLEYGEPAWLAPLTVGVVGFMVCAFLAFLFYVMFSKP